jgi:hypothetical protein
MLVDIFSTQGGASEVQGRYIAAAEALVVVVNENILVAWDVVQKLLSRFQAMFPERVSRSRFSRNLSYRHRKDCRKGCIDSCAVFLVSRYY